LTTSCRFKLTTLSLTISRVNNNQFTPARTGNLERFFYAEIY
jgi:hypothetical protein